MKPLVTTVEEVLRNAILAEDESRSYYLKLSEYAAGRDVMRKLIEIADRQAVHRKILENKYRKDVGADPPSPSLPPVTTPPDIGKIDMGKALKLALERERESESNFRFLAERVPGTELGSLFWELADFKWKHKVQIQNEIDTVVDPEGFLRF